MATVDRKFAENIAANNGYYNGISDNSLGDNPRCVKIIKYENAWGAEAFGLVMEWEKNRYLPSMFVKHPSVFWEFSPETVDTEEDEA